MAKPVNSVAVSVGPAAKMALGSVVTNVFANTTAVDLIATGVIPNGTVAVRMHCVAQAVLTHGTAASASATGFPSAAAATSTPLIMCGNRDHFWVSVGAAATAVIELYSGQPA